MSLFSLMPLLSHSKILLEKMPLALYAYSASCHAGLPCLDHAMGPHSTPLSLHFGDVNKMSIFCEALCLGVCIWDSVSDFLLLQFNTSIMPNIAKLS